MYQVAKELIIFLWARQTGLEEKKIKKGGHSSQVKLVDVGIDLKII